MNWKWPGPAWVLGGKISMLTIQATAFSDLYLNFNISNPLFLKFCLVLNFLNFRRRVERRSILVGSSLILALSFHPRIIRFLLLTNSAFPHSLFHFWVSKIFESQPSSRHCTHTGHQGSLHSRVDLVFFRIYPTQLSFLTFPDIAVSFPSDCFFDSHLVLSLNLNSLLFFFIFFICNLISFLPIELSPCLVKLNLFSRQK